MENYDFHILEKYRGDSLELPRRDCYGEAVELIIPKDAVYISIMTIEDNAEFNGNPNKTNKQKIFYYSEDGEIKGIQDLDRDIITEKLVKNLERLFEKNANN